ncbi:hypothetical protein IT399_01955 [Candidatus Nomurabacteria bacterium]|nr:hypothetical protein [Candidatus Nomurabacteria bacterium]
MKKIIFIFITAFVLNAIWENLHSFLYDNYMGGKITEFILLRASLFDALLITLISLPFLYLYFLKNKSWLILVFGTVIAILNEWYGLNTSRWAYNALMPIIPILETGITPTIQLGLLGYATFKISEKF